MKTALILFCSLYMVNAQNSLLLSDDFSGQNAPWLFHRDGTVKYDNDAIESGHGYLRIRLLNPNPKEECNVGISNPQPVYGKKWRQLTVQLRVKAINNMQPGSRGWGFWKTAKNGRADNLAWFMQQFFPKSPKFSWGRFGSLYKKQARWHEYKPDKNTWHTYKIVRDLYLNTTRYFVDGQQKFSTPGIAPLDRMAFHLWVDNQVYSRSMGIRRLGWKGQSGLIVDYVQIYDGTSAAISFPNEGAIKLNEQPRFFFDDFVQANRPEYNIVDMKGAAWLLADVRAEKMNGQATNDKLILKAISADSDKTLFWDAGENQVKAMRLPNAALLKIRFKNQGTPFLNRILILNSPGGKMLIDKPYPGTVKGKRTIRFSNTKEWMIIVLSVTGAGGGRAVIDAGQVGHREFRVENGERLFVRRTALTIGEHTLTIFAENNLSLKHAFLFQE